MAHLTSASGHTRFELTKEGETHGPEAQSWLPRRSYPEPPSLRAHCGGSPVQSQTPQSGCRELREPINQKRQAVGAFQAGTSSPGAALSSPLERNRHTRVLGFPCTPTLPTAAKSHSQPLSSPPSPCPSRTRPASLPRPKLHVDPDLPHASRCADPGSCGPARFPRYVSARPPLTLHCGSTLTDLETPAPQNAANQPTGVGPAPTKPEHRKTAPRFAHGCASQGSPRAPPFNPHTP